MCSLCLLVEIKPLNYLSKIRNIAIMLFLSPVSLIIYFFIFSGYYLLDNAWNHMVKLLMNDISFATYMFWMLIYLPYWILYLKIAF